MSNIEYSKGSPNNTRRPDQSHKRLEEVYLKKILQRVDQIAKNPGDDADFYTQVRGADLQSLRRLVKDYRDKQEQLDLSLREQLTRAKREARYNMQQALEARGSTNHPEFVQREHGNNVLKIVTENRQEHEVLSKRIQYMERTLTSHRQHI